MSLLLTTALPDAVPTTTRPDVAAGPAPAPARATGPAPAPARREPARRVPYLRAVRTVEDAVVPSADPLTPAPLHELGAEPHAEAGTARAGSGVTDRARVPFTELGRDVTPLRSLHGPAADPARVCASILQVAAEAMRGIRPLVQLVRWVDGGIFDELAAFAPTHGARTSVRQRLDPGSVAAVLAQGRLRKIRVARISPHVAECTVLTEAAGRVRAVVVRLEERRSRWHATALAAL